MLSWLTNIRTFLAGKKTYLCGVAAILTAFAAWATGDLSNKELITAVIAAVTAMNLRAGISKATKVSVILAGLLFANGAMAQEPTVPKLAGIVGGAVDYLITNGKVGVGYATALTFDESDRGTALIYSLDTPIGVKFNAEHELKLALVYQSVFIEGQSNRQVLGLGAVYHFLKLPPTAAGIVAAPKEAAEAIPVVSSVGKVLPDLSEVYIEPTIGLLAEDVANVQLDWKRVYIGLQASFKF